MSTMSKRAMRRERRRLRGEVGKANAKAHMYQVMYYARLREMDQLLRERDVAIAQLERFKREQPWMCTGLLIVPPTRA